LSEWERGDDSALSGRKQIWESMDLNASVRIQEKLAVLKRFFLECLGGGYIRTIEYCQEKFFVVCPEPGFAGAPLREAFSP
jgi:hypothetical protein